MQNVAARILTDTRKYDHITPALRALDSEVSFKGQQKHGIVSVTTLQLLDH